jgi:hypothetical protein
MGRQAGEFGLLVAMGDVDAFLAGAQCAQDDSCDVVGAVRDKAWAGAALM